MSDLPVDASALRKEVKSKYRAVALDPHGAFHFHTGRPLTQRLGYDEAVVAELRTVRLRLLPASATRFRWAPSSPASASSISARVAVSTASSQPGWWAGGT
jgi:hypothetical protein